MRDGSRRHWPRAVLDLSTVVHQRHGVGGDHRVGAEDSAVEQVSVCRVVLAKHFDDCQAAGSSARSSRSRAASVTRSPVGR
jgi:hypothetical protein